MKKWWSLVVGSLVLLSSLNSAFHAGVRGYSELFPSIRDDLLNMQRRITQKVESALDADGAGGAAQLSSQIDESPFFRAVSVLLLGRALSSDLRVAAQHCLLAEIVEMMYTAQTIHETVLDRSDAASGNVFHRTYSKEIGNKVSVLAGDYLLAQCSVGLGQFGKTEVVEKMGHSLETMVHGSLLRSRETSGNISLKAYEGETALRTCALLSDACFCAALVSDYDDDDVTRAAETFGHELAMAYQAMRDVKAYADEESKTQQQQHTPGMKNNKVMTLPLVLAHEAADPKTKEALERALRNDRPADLRLLIDTNDGLQRALTFANDRARRALDSLDALPFDQEKRDALRVLVRSVIDRSI